jgi:hypothetical protein
MKKSIIFFLLLLFIASASNAQEIKFEKTLEKAKQLSKEKKLPLALILNINTPIEYFPENLRTSMDLNLKGLNDVEVAKKFNDHFIVCKIDFSPIELDSNINSLISTYRISQFPAFVFIDSKGGLFYKDFGNAPTPQKYLDMLQKAIDASKQKSIVDYDNQFKTGKYDAGFLKAYITKRMEMGLFNNSVLIELYVNFLRVVDLDDYNEVLFILKAGPLYFGKAYKLAYVNKSIFDSIYKTESIAVRSAINNSIIINSFEDAVASRSVTKASMVSSFVRGTWTNDFREGSKQASLKMIQYYQAVKDTNNYLQQASYFYDQYFMNIGVDSIKKLDAINKEKMDQIFSMESKRATNFDSIKNSSGKIVTSQAQSSSFSIRSGSSYATELNNAAWSFYQTGTKNTNYLTKALFWSKRSIEINPIAAYYDTLAHILYLLGFYSEAESTQEKAVEMAKQAKMDVKKMQEDLNKMKQKTLL